MPALNGHKVRYLSRADVEALGMRSTEVVALLDAAFVEKANDAVEMPPKIGVHPRPDGFIHAMPAHLRDSDVVGMKWIAGYPTNSALGLPYLHGVMILTDAPTGRPLAVMDATWITEIRTAAVSVLGIRALIPAPPATVAIIGCGRQGTVHAELMLEIWSDISEVRLYDPITGRAERLGRSLDAALTIVAANAGEAARGADVVVSSAPIVVAPTRSIGFDDLAANAVACAVDFDATFQPNVAEGCDLFVVDDCPQYEYYRSQGYFDGYAAEPVELAQVLRGDAPAGAGLRLYVPLGLALTDVALAGELYHRARAADVGVDLDA